MFTKKTTLIIPTKNRFKLLLNTLTNLKNLKIKFNEILVIDSSDRNDHERIKKISKKFSLKVFKSKPSSSIQRNKGINKMNKSNKYFMLLDDDITFYKNSFKNMNSILKLNKNKRIIGFAFCQKKQKGSFLEKLKNSYLSSLLGLYEPEPGRVLKSGWQTKIYKTKKNYYADWLPTAATIYKKNYVKSRFDTTFGEYSYLEDLDFSIGVKKNNFLLVVSDAIFSHKNEKKRTSFLFGYYEIINRCKIVKKYKFNLYHFYYISFIKILMNLLEVLINLKSILKFLGNIVGLIGTLKIILKN